MVLDALAQRAVLDTRADPPAKSGDGDSYRIATSATGEWSHNSGNLAIRVGSAWHFVAPTEVVAPTEGLTVFDRRAGQWLWFRSGWQSAAAPSQPTSGTVIDTEARTLLAQIIVILQSAGLVAPEPV